MMKCKVCGFEVNGNIAMSKHYKHEPEHRPSYKTRKILSTPQHISVEDKIRNLYQELKDIIQKNNDQISNLQSQISTLKADNERLNKLRLQIDPHPITAYAVER